MSQLEQNVDQKALAMRVRYVLLFHQEQGKCLIECATTEVAKTLCDKYTRDTDTISTTIILPEWITDQHRRHARRYKYASS